MCIEEAVCGEEIELDDTIAKFECNNSNMSVSLGMLGGITSIFTLLVY